MVLELVFVSVTIKVNFSSQKHYTGIMFYYGYSMKNFNALPLNAVVFNCKDFKYCSVLYFWISFGSLHTLCLGYFMLKVLNLMDSNLVMVDFSWNLLARILVLVAIR
ncbi:hypothetical protein QL285_003215 [Trifolium repens]|nr:hypothetical protein QL285_003215 [Trifolium repens]